MPTFLVTVSKPCGDDYANTASELVASLHDVMTNESLMTTIWGEFDDANVEVGVKLEDGEVVARCVARVAAEKTSFNKPNFNKALRASGLDAFSLRKQAISDDEATRLSSRTDGEAE